MPGEMYRDGFNDKERVPNAVLKVGLPRFLATLSQK